VGVCSDTVAKISFRAVHFHGRSRAANIVVWSKTVVIPWAFQIRKSPSQSNTQPLQVKVCHSWKRKPRSKRGSVALKLVVVGLHELCENWGKHFPRTCRKVPHQTKKERLLSVEPNLMRCVFACFANSKSNEAQACRIWRHSRPK
jgi:hypothetical protein